MKTDRFDETFRRKLLGLPADTDPGDVDRIHEYVRTNKPALPGAGWSKLLFYGGGGLLLIGSISYNIFQNYRNIRLQSSLDSLVHQSVSQVLPREVVRHDTVYLTKNGRNEEVAALPPTRPETAGEQSQESGIATQPDQLIPDARVALERPTRPRPEAVPNRPYTDAPRSELASDALTKAIEPAEPYQRVGRPNQLPAQAVNLAPALGPTRSRVAATESANGPETRPKPVVVGNYPDLGLSRAARRGNVRNRVGQTSTDTRGLPVATYAQKQRQRTPAGRALGELFPLTSGNSTYDEPVSERNRLTVVIEPLASRQVARVPHQLALTMPGRPLPAAAPSVPATRRSWHLTMPRLAVPNAQYRIGAALTGGNHLLGGSVLAELMLNRYWSLQTGLGFVYSQGFHYRDEQEFDEHEPDSFRQKYAPQVPVTADIQDISQVSRIVQVPIQLAYHQPLGRQWGLRLGVGTDLDIGVHTDVRYDYRGNGRSPERSLLRGGEPVYLFNNLTLSTAVERSSTKWLLRAGPFISPQLRPVAYKPDHLSWGANLQIFYRLGN